MHTIKKVLIIERNEMGIRALETCLEIGLDFVVGFSSSDSDSLLVKKAKKYCVSQKGSGISYLGDDLHDGYSNIEKIIDTARLWNCDAIYPGYNVLSENYSAVKKIEAAGLIWIGPSAKIIKVFSNRYTTRKLAKQYGLDVLDAFLIESKKRLSKNIPDGKMIFPFMLKTFTSGGGRGNEMIMDLRELESKLANVNTQEKNYYAEKYVSGRHIELQFIADGRQVKYLGTRDCSCQIKFQKIFEEGLVNIDKKQLANLERKLAPLLLDLDYTGIGTAEFIYSQKENKFYFLEINPRIQVESPVTEKLFGIDLVTTQFALAQNNKIVLRKKYLALKKYAVEARIYARDPYHHFTQSTGTIKLFKTAKLTGITYYTGYQVGDIVPDFYDPLLLKIVSVGHNRQTALQKLRQSLEALDIIGLITNKDLLLWLLSQKEFRNKDLTQDFIEIAWQKHLDHIRDDKRKFLATGIFKEIISTRKIDPQKLINDLKYSRNGTRRNYLDELNSKHTISPQKTAFRFGIFQRDNSSTIFAWWDFSYFGGTLGVDEALAVEKCFELAQQKKMPCIMVTRSGGARQQENTLALAMMQYILASYRKYGEPFLINIYDQENFGGLNASLSGLADIKIAVAGSHIGLTGPKFLATLISAEEKLPASAQGAKEHYTARNIDHLSLNLLSACENAFEICTLIYDKNKLSEFKQKKAKINLTKSKGFSVSDCLNRLNNLKRLRLSDLLVPEMKIFEEIIPFRDSISNNTTHLPIMGAMAQIDKYKVMIIGQQSLSRDGHNLSPSAKDFRWFRGKMKLAEKLNLPIILLGDTNGADASLDSEYAGVSQEISEAIMDQTKLSVPIISINIGLCGSGGGLPFVNQADAAGALEYSLKMVSDIRVQGAILSGNDHLASPAQKKLLNILQDSTAQGQMHYGFIDEIIPHADDKNVLAKNIADFIIKKLVELAALDKKNLLKRRFKRQKTAINRVIIPLTK